MVKTTNLDFLTESYDYDLPPELIADRPVDKREESRLLVYRHQTGQVEHLHFKDLPEILPQKSCLVFNRSKVFPCRLLGQRPSGGRAELFVLSLNPDVNGHYPCLLRSKGPKEIGESWFFCQTKATLKRREDSVFWMEFSCPDLPQFLEEFGRTPIPPYIRKGRDDEHDKAAYQTLYAKELGSVAAPTAGLHFSERLLNNLEQKQIGKAEIVLHVGMGTFLPVSSESIKDHKMHREEFFVDVKNAAIIEAYDGNLIAVGTTSLRALESSYHNGEFNFRGHGPCQTDIFLHPGVEVKSIKGLITNFHLPKSTLLMLVSSLIGREKTLELYQLAIKERYRFYSYGDGMLILR